MFDVRMIGGRHVINEVKIVVEFIERSKTSEYFPQGHGKRPHVRFVSVFSLRQLKSRGKFTRNASVGIN